MRHIRNKKGLDIPIGGAPEATIEDAHDVQSVALLGTDYVGLEPKMMVAKGDRVALGQPLFQHKRDPAIIFTAPASGIVSNIHRGERRALKAVVIDIDGEDHATETKFETGTAEIPPQVLRARLLESGLWTAFRTRPFSRIPHSEARPRSIFVTCCDTRPLSGDPKAVVDLFSEAFSLGLDVLAQLVSSKVFLCTGGDWQGPTGSASSIEHVLFEGPHPAGLPGTHIHHLDRVGPDPEVWHIGYQDVIAIGKLIGEGCIWTERIVALGGEGFSKPRMVRTRIGAEIAALTTGELAKTTPDNVEARLISGCVLSGRHARGAEAYLGRYHLQISAVPQMRQRSWRPWRRPHENRYSFANVFSRFQSEPAFTTDQNGRAAAMVPTDTFERLIPMDVLAAPLLKSLLILDTDNAQALGALELDEEDLALCSFVCPGKNDYASVLRRNLEVIERDG